MNKIERCPYCGSKDIELAGGNDWFCNECGNCFDMDDCEHQHYWEKISCLLNGTSESEPMLVDYILPSVEDESCGLSDLEKLNIDKVYQIEGYGTMWYHFEGTTEWNDMYELSTRDLKGLYEYLLTI